MSKISKKIILLIISFRSVLASVSGDHLKQPVADLRGGSQQIRAGVSKQLQARESERKYARDKRDKRDNTGTHVENM
jgi:hypothetical protein